MGCFVPLPPPHSSPPTFLKGDSASRQQPLDVKQPPDVGCLPIAVCCLLSANPRSANDAATVKGGHDSRFAGNIVYHGHNDGQNCVNTWPFLPGHGAVYTGNKCILPRSTNIGNVGDGIVPGCATCPGEKKDLQPWNPIYTTDTWRALGGIRFASNEYFTSDPDATSVNCDCTIDSTFPGSCGKNPPGFKQPSFDEWQIKYGNDEGSTLGNVPSDEVLLQWARSKLGMPAAPAA